MDSIDRRILARTAYSDAVIELVEIVDEIEDQVNLLELEDLDIAGLGEKELVSIFRRRERLYEEEITAFQYTTWPAFVRNSIAYCAQNDVDELLPWNAFLTETDFKKMKSESYSAQYKWDKWDYIFVGLAGILGALTDIFLVRIPKTMTAGQYFGQKGSPITEKLPKLKFPDSM
ncbi:MAG: hypothetical protein K8S24_09600, partial [Candidatus Aegiribacteria sp.]|nr:hypothetical protein [Candidatus Aegiribacteria sp.]